MQIHRPSKLKVGSLTVVFAIALMMAQPRPAHAYVDPYSAFVVAVAAVVVTYAAVKATVCVPVAVFKASDHPNGFTGAFGECFRPGQKQTAAAPIEKDNSLQFEPEEPTLPPAESASAGTEAEALAQ